MLAFVQLAVSLCSAVASMVVATTGSLEEVLEHGPLFDELQDEAWWNGVEVIDSLVLSTPDYFDDIGVDGDNFCQLWNSCGSNGFVVRLPPPPPVPPQLTDLIRQLQQATTTANSKQSEEDETSEACLLCEWARLNNTVDFIPNSGESIFIDKQPPSTQLRPALLCSFCRIKVVYFVDARLQLLSRLCMVVSN